MILVTSADNKSQNEDLAIFATNIEKTILGLKVCYETFFWKDDLDISRYDQNKLLKFEMIINTHSQFCWQSGFKHPRMINFIHGDQVQDGFTEDRSSFFKTNFMGNNYLPLENAFFNIFTSEEALKKSILNGFPINYSRDLVIHDISDCGKLIQSILDKSEAA